MTKGSLLRFVVKGFINLIKGSEEFRPQLTSDNILIDTMALQSLKDFGYTLKRVS